MEGKKESQGEVEQKAYEGKSRPNSADESTRVIPKYKVDVLGDIFVFDMTYWFLIIIVFIILSFFISGYYTLYIYMIVKKVAI